MKRAEYEAMIKQREEIDLALERFGWIVEEILDGMGIKNAGEVKVVSLEGEMAHVKYLEPGCHGSCCGKSYEYVDIPATWVFGEVDWKAEHARNQAAIADRLDRERRAADEAERLAQEERDREEFERLKNKFEPKATGDPS